MMKLDSNTDTLYTKKPNKSGKIFKKTPTRFSCKPPLGNRKKYKKHRTWKFPKRQKVKLKIFLPVYEVVNK